MKYQTDNNVHAPNIKYSDWEIRAYHTASLDSLYRGTDACGAANFCKYLNETWYYGGDSENSLLRQSQVAMVGQLG